MPDKKQKEPFGGEPIVSDLIRSLADPAWRLSNLYKIKSKKGEIVDLIPNQAQSMYLALRRKKNIILKARQLGFSTLCLIDLLDKTLFRANTTSVILAHKKDVVQKLFKIIKFAYDNYPRDIPKPKAKYDTKNELEFSEINSRIYVTTEVRGDTIDYLHISELAFMDEAEDRMIATMAAVTPDGQITIESTANGVGNYFYDFYNTAEERGYKPHFYPWFIAPEYKKDSRGKVFDEEERAIQKKLDLSDDQLAWRQMKKRELREKFEQEYPASAEEAFIATGNNIFPAEELNRLIPKEPITQGSGLFIWENPKMGHRYTMGVDVSEGIGGDESAIDIIDVTTGEQVFHLSGQLTVPLLAEKVEEYAKRYNDAYIIPEANNHGFSLIYLLRDRHLDIYKREKFDGPHVKRVQRLGWLTTKRTKPLMIQGLISALYEDDIKINHKKTIAQMKTFITDAEDGTMKAAPGKKDDCVMSLALAWQGTRLLPVGERKAHETFSFNSQDTFSGISY